MPNHQNRNRDNPSRNPSPEEVKAARASAGITQEQAGAILHTTGRVWRQWESGDRRMHPAFRELFTLKTGSGGNNDTV